jgi:hypothetical protein
MEHGTSSISTLIRFFPFWGMASSFPRYSP